MDELWSFVRRRKDKRWIDKRWIWLAQCRRTRQIVAYVIGSRGEEACRLLWERVPAAYKGGVQGRRTRAAYKGGLCYTDFWAAYAEVLPQEQCRAMGKGAGQTNHVERFNNVLRQRLGRSVGRTLSFSKSDVMYEACLLLFLHEHSCTSTTSRPGISPGESDSIKPLPKRHTSPTRSRP